MPLVKNPTRKQITAALCGFSPAHAAGERADLARPDGEPRASRVWAVTGKDGRVIRYRIVAPWLCREFNMATRRVNVGAK